jgi:hypothetical protein
MTEQPTKGVDERLLQVACLAADMWWMEHAHSGMTNAEITRGVVTNAVMHLIEQGLLVVPEDLTQRLDKPISIRRVEVTEDTP